MFLRAKEARKSLHKIIETCMLMRLVASKKRTDAAKTPIACPLRSSHKQEASVNTFQSFTNTRTLQHATACHVKAHHTTALYATACQAIAHRAAAYHATTNTVPQHIKHRILRNSTSQHVTASQYIVLSLHCAYYHCTMPTITALCLLSLHCAYYHCTVHTITALCLLSLHCAYYH